MLQSAPSDLGDLNCSWLRLPVVRRGFVYWRSAVTGQRLRFEAHIPHPNIDGDVVEKRLTPSLTDCVKCLRCVHGLADRAIRLHQFVKIRRQLVAPKSEQAREIPGAGAIEKTKVGLVAPVRDEVDQENRGRLVQDAGNSEELRQGRLGLAGLEARQLLCAGESGCSCEFRRVYVPCRAQLAQELPEDRRDSQWDRCSWLCPPREGEGLADEDVLRHQREGVELRNDVVVERDLNIVGAREGFKGTGAGHNDGPGRHETLSDFLEGPQWNDELLPSGRHLPGFLWGMRLGGASRMALSRRTHDCVPRKYVALVGARQDVGPGGRRS